MSKALPTKWSGKEVGVTIGYGVLLLLCFFIADCLGFLGPTMWIYGTAVVALFAGIPYFYIAAREPRYGTFTIVGILFLLYGLLGGSLSNPPYLVLTLLGLLLPDLIRLAMGFQSFAGTLVSYLVFVLTKVGAPINVWLMPEWCHAQAVEEMNEQYADALVYGHAGALQCVIFLLAVLLAAFIGAYIAKAVLRKPLAKYDTEATA